MIKKLKKFKVILASDATIIDFDKGYLKTRSSLVVTGFSVLFLILIVKLVLTSSGDKFAAIEKFNPQKLYRNEIVDRNGVLLAVDLAAVSLYANPKLLFDYKLTAKKLVEIFPDLKQAELEKNFSGNRSFVWIKRNITPREQHSVNQLGILGLEFENGSKRLYPQGNIFAHVLGYVDTDDNGIAGIEKQFNDFLINNKNDKLRITLDARVQSIIHDELSKSIAEFNAKGAIGIVMNANNGEILGMVSLPDYDPNLVKNVASEKLFNQCTLGVYELGSIMKSLTIAMALETKAVALNDIYQVKEPLKASRFVIHDYRPKLSQLSVPQIFMYSSNIGTAMISLEVGTKNQIEYLKKFGLFDPLKIEVPEKGLPIYPAEKNWTEINTMTISFGHGIAISPLHFMRASTSLINDGYLLEPTLIFNQKNNKNNKILSDETSETMRKLMRLTIKYGSGKKAEVEGFNPGGKTGSAEKAKKGGYSKSEKLSLFFAAFPIHKPEYVTLVILDDPRPNSYTPYTGGAWTSAPATGKIINRIAPLLNVKPVNNNDPEILKNLWLDFDPGADEKEQIF